MALYYQDDFVTLYHGDCLQETTWLGADVLVTDPPFGINISQFANVPKRYRKQSREAVIKNDNDTALRDTVLELWGDRPAIVFGSWKRPRPENVRHRLLWYKSRAAPGLSAAPWFSADEEIYILGSGFTGKPIQNVYTTNEYRANPGGPAAKIGHPTPKPIGLMERLIEKCPDGVIADPMAGSGATLMAARNLGRRAIGVEIEERYCEIIAGRVAQQVFDFA